MIKRIRNKIILFIIPIEATLKKIALSILPIIAIISLGIFIYNMLTYVPSGIHASLVHIYDELFARIAFCVMFLYAIDIFLIWFSVRFRWYIELLNALVLIILVMVLMGMIFGYVSDKIEKQSEIKKELSVKKLDKV